ncbi:hypothetical protein BST13_34265 [Mycobacterium aquaticum]|uniref:Amino acid permease/ SLC12A domain-containing protein n=2 Tax=Mycobacterium aquaticum TaxID=1927124 RepID=A0A1X0A2N9_9MYCO|nr:hypothetical protein BST13_34265 [Mycobacterium aquaticum]
MEFTGAVANGGPAADVDVNPHALRGNLSTFHILFGVLAFQGPLVCVVAFIPVVIGYGNGLGAPVAYLSAGALIAMFCVGFLKMSRHVKNPGGFYSYVTEGLGKELGLGASFLAIVGYTAFLLGFYPFVGVLLNSFVTEVFGGPDIQWWAWAILSQCLVGILGYFNIQVGARVLTVLMALEGVVIVVFDAVVIAKGGATGLSGESFLPENVLSGSIGVALMFAVIGFSGFEVTVVFRDEVRDPERTIPRAAFLFTAVVAVGYSLTAWVLIEAVGPAKILADAAADPAGTVLGAIETYLGTITVHLVAALLCTSAFAAQLAIHNVVARYGFNLAVDGVAPKRMGFPHPRHGSPHRASIVLSVLIALGFVTTALSGADPTSVYAQFSGVLSYALIMLLVMTALSVLVFMKRNSAAARGWRRWIAPALALVGLAVVLWLATTNISLLITGGPGVVAVVFGILYGCLVVGAVYARVLKRRCPETYAKIGRR